MISDGIWSYRLSFKCLSPSLYKEIKKKTSELDKNDIQSEILEDSFYSRLKFF